MGMFWFPKLRFEGSGYRKGLGSSVGASIGEEARRGRPRGQQGNGRSWPMAVAQERGTRGLGPHFAASKQIPPPLDSPQPEQGQAPPSPLPHLTLTLGSVLGQLSLILARIPLGGFSENPSPLKPTQCPHPHPGPLPRSCK